MKTTHASEVAWELLTAGEISDIGERDGSISLLPIGSTEQHGNHLPVFTDTLLVKAMARLGANRVAEDQPVVVAPTLWTWFSPHHLPFGGTISVGFETLLHALEDIAASILENGFDAVLIVNGHGGNAGLVNAATSMIGENHPAAQVLSVTYFKLAEPFIAEIRDSDLGGMSHCGEFETSLMLHLYPALVNLNEADADYLDEPYSHSIDDMMAGGPLGVYRGFDEYSDSGAIGDPGLATAEKGAAIYENLGDELEDVLTEIYE